MLNGTPPIITGLKDGLMSVFTAFAYDGAMETGKVVNLDKYWALLDEE